MHAATRAGAHHAAAREALLRYVLRPPIAKERVEPQQDGLVRQSLKRAFADGAVAVDMDPLSLLCRLAASVPPPRFHTVKCAGVLASASRPRWRLRMHATRATFDVLPRAASRAQRAATTWAWVSATTAAMSRTERTAARPPQMLRRPCIPLSLLNCARPKAEALHRQ
ncbi:MULTISPECIES: transposase [Sorangium]|uniref:transposase n=1 Tax=Sorangium TaxID=39643 RepID=UPI003D9C221A